MKPVLELRSVTKRFGGIVAVSNLDFQLVEGEIVGLIGPNGSGKTVTLNLCTGVYAPDSGAIFIRGTPFNQLQEWKINRLGLVRTFQTVKLWSGMSVLENVMAANSRWMSAPFWEVILRTSRARKEEKQTQEAAFEALRTTGMAAFAYKTAEDLSFGQQRLVELARALVINPTCVLLDEPAAGLKAELIVQLGKLIKMINQEYKTAFLVVEHRTRLVMDICSRIVVLDHGVKIADGLPNDIRNNEQVIRAYLGTKHNTPLLREELKNAPNS